MSRQLYGDGQGRQLIVSRWRTRGGRRAQPTQVANPFNTIERLVPCITPWSTPPGFLPSLAIIIQGLGYGFGSDRGGSGRGARGWERRGRGKERGISPGWRFSIVSL